MKVEDLFRIGEKTVFSGALETESKAIASTACVLEIDGEPVGKLHIQGEVHTGKGCRDLWTTSPVNLTREIVRDREVWLVSA